MPPSSEQPKVPVGPELDNRRIAAALIDLLVPGALFALLTLAGVPATLPVLVVVALWSGFYAFACESGAGQTLGKRLLGLRVVDARGRHPEMRDIAMRSVVGIVDRNIVGLIAMLVSGDSRQRLGDLAAGTYVTYADAEPEVREALVRPAARRAPAPLPVAASPLPADIPVVSEPQAPVFDAPTAAEPDSDFFESPGRAVTPPAPAAETDSDYFESPGHAVTPPVEAPRPRIELDLDAPVPEITFGVPGEAPEEADDEPLPDYAPFGGPPSEEPVTPPPAPARGPMSLIEQAGEADADDTEVVVKPIQTVSAMDLIMQDAEERNPGS